MHLLRFLFTMLMLLVPGVCVVFAQNDTTVYLQTITITENRLQTPYLQSARTANILTREDLQNSPGQQLSEALKSIPGLDVRERGPNGVQADLSLRGGTFDQTLILLNGIKLSDPQTGHHSLALPLNLDNIERVEVLKGPSARVFGQNAFAGAINIITQIPDQARFDLNTYGGDFGTMGVSAGLAVPLGKGIKSYLSLSQDQSNGYRHNTDFITTNAFLDTEIDAGQGFFRIQTGYSDRRFGANGFYASPGVFRDQYEAIKTSLASIAYTYQGQQINLTPRVYWRRNEDLFQLRRGEPEFYQNEHLSDVVGAELNSRWDNTLGQTGIGLEFRQESIQSSNLGDHSRQSWGLFVEHRLAFGNFSLTPGVHLNQYSDFGFNAFPGIDIGWQVRPHTFVFGQAGTSYRIPTYTDLYYEDPSNRGNPDLQPEQAFIYEIGLRQSGRGWLWEMSFFDQFAQQLIDWTRTSDTEAWQVGNFTDLRMSGLETQLTLEPQQLSEASWAAAITRFSLGYNYLQGTLEDQNEGVSSRYVLQQLRHQLILQTAHRVAGKLSHDLRVRWSERVTGDAFWVVDSRLTWQERSYAFFAEASNLTNTSYVGVNLVPMPGRWFRAGLRLQAHL